jgi:hypothetical protein
MRKRAFIVALVASAIVAAVAGTALAKGPESATITGPGIDEPIEIELFEPANPDLVHKLMGQTSLWLAPSGDSRIHGEPTGDLGPAYTLTWINAGPPGDPVEERTIRQILYPLAERGPMIETPSQIGLEGWGPEVIGWFVAPNDLADTLTALGVPVSEQQSNGDASTTSIPEAAVLHEVEPAGRVRYLSAAGIVLVIVLIWTVRRRTASTVM